MLSKTLAWAVVIVVVIFAGAIGKLIGQNTTDRFLDGKREGTLDATLKQAATELNENLPMMVDADTRLDTSIGINGKFRYNYTLVNYTAEELDSNALKEAMRPKLVNSYCTVADMRTFVENNVPVTYAYSGKDGKEIVTITVTSEECE
jgi:hypothetical protein